MATQVSAQHSASHAPPCVPCCCTHSHLLAPVSVTAGVLLSCCNCLACMPMPRLQLRMQLCLSGHPVVKAMASSYAMQHWTHPAAQRVLTRRTFPPVCMWHPFLLHCHCDRKPSVKPERADSLLTVRDLTICRSPASDGFHPRPQHCSCCGLQSLFFSRALDGSPWLQCCQS